MISCVVCSRRADISANLKENIASTIGCKYELIVIDNSKKEYSIFSAYNEGIRRAKGNILCFMHEDILYRSRDWGNLLTQTFVDESIGIVGVVGSQYLPNKVTSWWLCGTTKGQIIQGGIDANKCYATMLDGVKVNDLTDVVVVDGFWFSMNKSFANIVKFDEKIYNSFHCYDLDICMQMLMSNKRVVVRPDILIEHYSMGNVRTSYYQQLELFYNKWQSQLPIWRGINITKEEALWVSNILEGYQKVVCRNVMLENSWAYRLGRYLLKPIKMMIK